MHWQGNGPAMQHVMLCTRVNGDITGKSHSLLQAKDKVLRPKSMS